MAFELYEMLAGNVNPVTGEYIKPASGGGDEAFLQKVVAPIYNTIAKVCTYNSFIMCFCYS
jgi:callose synthase